VSYTREELLAIGAVEPEAGTSEALAEAESKARELAAKIRELESKRESARDVSKLLVELESAARSVLAANGRGDGELWLKHLRVMQSRMHPATVLALVAVARAALEMYPHARSAKLNDAIDELGAAALPPERGTP